MSANVPEQLTKSTPFNDAWQRALREYAEILPAEGKNGFDINDDKWKSIRSVDDFKAFIEYQHSNYDAATGQGTQHSTALQASLKGAELLINLFGGAAGSAFPPSSQILGAFSALLTAAHKTANALKAISDLFVRIHEFLGELQVLTEVTLEPVLETAITNILVLILRVCGVATHKAYCRDEDLVIKEKHGNRAERMWAKTKRVAGSRVSQFGKQLVLGSDPDIEGVISQLDQAIKAEKGLVSALVKQDTTVTRDNTTILKSDTTQIIAYNRAIETQINDLSREILHTTVCLEFDLEQLEKTVRGLEDRISGKVDTMLAKADDRANERQIVADAKADRRQTAADEKADKRHAAAEEKADDRTQYVVSVIKDELGRKFGDYVHQNQSGVAQDRATAKNKELSEKLKAILKPETATLNAFLDKLQNERTPGTCKWLLSEKAFTSWLERQTKQPVLLVSGKNGCGKTFLSSLVIEQLQKKIKSQGANQASSIAYFFCRKNTEKLSSVYTMLRTLASQISELDSHYSKIIGAKARLEAIEKARDAGQLMKELFVDYFKTNVDHSTYLVIDGIDECVDEAGEPVDFAEIFKGCISDGKWMLPNLQVLLSISSSENLAADVVAPGQLASLADDFGESAFTFLVDETRVENDLDLFVQDKLDKDWQDCIITEGLRDEVRTTIKKHCRGDFRRASLILDEVTSLSREDDVWARLSRPPKDLNAATSLIVRKISRGLDAHGLEDLIVSL
jgi:Cdc6-like AAA superfamily ATPase